MTTSSLDRPVWASLDHAPDLAAGNHLARRYRRDVNLFAAAFDDGPASLRALADLVVGDESVFLLQVPTLRVPDGLTAVSEAQGVQMVATRAIEPESSEDAIVVLGDVDAADMLALAKRTNPGPFRSRTHTMGRFIGIRIGGRLVAMAGERMRFPGFTEVSGVCTDPDFRGRGLARRLSSVVAQDIQQRGDQPFLHSWSSNTAAIALYEKLGFTYRATVHVGVLKKLA